MLLEESLPSTLASVYRWFTPAVLFVLLNLVIGTIAVASKSSAGRQHHQPGPAADDGGGAHPGRLLPRSPSVLLDRLRSSNLYRHPSGEATAPRAEIPDEPPLPEADAEDEHRGGGGGRPHQHFSRSQSDAEPTAGEMPPKLAVRMKKSAFAHFEEAEVAEARMDAADPAEGGEEHEVDARADDFINRFRQQLQLQRRESIMTTYKETLNRGSLN